LWEHSETLVNPEHLGYLPAESLLLVATGSQGEKNTALVRLSHERFNHLALAAGDRLIFSARAIPGNEQDIDALCDRLRAMGVEIIKPETCQQPIHASGHPYADELQLLYGWIRPKLVIPVHGEAHHLQEQKQIARQYGIQSQLVGANGDLFRIAPTVSVQRGVTPRTRLGIGSKGLQKIRPSS